MTLPKSIRDSDYALSGWRFRSAIPIEALPAWDGNPQHAPDIELVRGSVAEAAFDEPVVVLANDSRTATVLVEGVGRFAVLDGKKVVADVRPDALPGVIETMIVGPVLGALCYQRGVRSRCRAWHKRRRVGRR